MKYFIDDKEYSSETDKMSVEDILKSAELSPNEVDLYSESDESPLKAGTTVEISEGRKFFTKPHTRKIIHYWVNGAAQETSATTLSVKEILQNVGRDGGVNPERVEDYYLENTETDKRYLHPGDPVELVDGARFIAIYKSKTPVACAILN